MSVQPVPATALLVANMFVATALCAVALAAPHGTLPFKNNVAIEPGGVVGPETAAHALALLGRLGVSSTSSTTNGMHHGSEGNERVATTTADQLASADTNTTEGLPACWYLNRNSYSRAACDDARRRLVAALNDEGGDTGGGFAVSKCNASAALCSGGPSRAERDCTPVPCAVVAFTSASGLLYSVHTVGGTLLRGDVPQNEVAVPHLDYRALKLNLPWSP